MLLWMVFIHPSFSPNPLFCGPIKLYISTGWHAIWETVTQEINHPNLRTQQKIFGKLLVLPRNSAYPSIWIEFWHLLLCPRPSSYHLNLQIQIWRSRIHWWGEYSQYILDEMQSSHFLTLWPCVTHSTDLFNSQFFNRSDKVKTIPLS